MERPSRDAAKHKQQVLSEAVERGDAETVARLLSDVGADCERLSGLRKASAAGAAGAGEGEWTLLMKAASKGYSEICRQLVGAGAAVDDDVGGSTALMMACMVSNPETSADVASVLLAAGADPNLEDRFRETSLIKAAARGLTDAVHLLIRSNAQVNARDNKKRTALYYAAKGDHADTVRCLLEAGADEESRAEALAVAEEKELSNIITVLAGPKQKDDSVDSVEPAAPLLNHVFKSNVLAELPSGDGRVGFPSNVPLLLSGVGQDYYSPMLAAAGFGIAQVITAGDKELQDAGVRLAPQRLSIMQGMKRLALHEWREASVPPLTTSIRSCVHAVCSAVRQIHIMWATSLLARLRHDPDVEGDADLDGRMTADAISIVHKAMRYAEIVRRQAKTVAALAASKSFTDPAPPSDLIPTSTSVCAVAVSLSDSRTAIKSSDLPFI